MCSRTTASRRSRNVAPSCDMPALLLRPEALDHLHVVARVVASYRADDQHGVLGALVPDRADHLGRDPHHGSGGEVHHLVLELELEDAGDHEVDLLLGLVLVAVAALAARLGRHPPPGEADLLGAEGARGAHPHLAGIVAHHIRHLLELQDRVVGHAPHLHSSSARRARGTHQSSSARAHSLSAGFGCTTALCPKIHPYCISPESRPSSSANGSSRSPIARRKSSTTSSCVASMRHTSWTMYQASSTAG